MASIANILENYSTDERRFKRAIRKYAVSIVKEFNSHLNLSLEIKNIDFYLDTTIDTEIIIGNDEYCFLFFLYMDKINPEYTMYDAIEMAPTLYIPKNNRMHIELTDTPREIARLMFGFIDPRDIVKFKQGNIKVQ